MTVEADAAPPELPGLTYVRHLGKGGYAEVYLYEQASPRMRVAVKVLSGEGLTEQTRERFAAEANAMAELADHPNIVQVFRTDITADGRPYLVMKYYPQRNLAIRARVERLSVPEVLRIGVRIACAVETAHRVGIIHRDIKPANILTSQYGEPGLTDFGIATTAGDGPPEADGMSVPWAPPEVVFGVSPGDRASDVYALGATLWHLLVGRSPFETPDGDNTSLALMRRIREQAPPRTARDDVPASLERLLAQAMSKVPEDRPRSALDLARALQTIETEQRWLATPLVLLDGHVDEQDEADDPTDHRIERSGDASDSGRDTKIRSPQTVRPQTPRSATRTPGGERIAGGVVNEGPASATVQRVSGAAPSADAQPRSFGPRPARVRHGLPGAPDVPHTVRRATEVVTDPPLTAEPLASTEALRPRSRRTKTLAAVSIGAIAAIVVIGLVLAGGHGSHGSTPTTIPGPGPTIASIPLPETPTLTATRLNSDNVSFHWTDPGGPPGDAVRYEIAGVTGWKAVPRDPFTLVILAGNYECVQIQVVRSDGQRSEVVGTTPANGACPSQ